MGVDLLKEQQLNQPKLINAALNVDAATYLAVEANNRLKNYSDDFRSAAISTISLNLNLGIGVRQTATQLRNQLKITKFKAETLVRTESLHALNETAKAFYAENDIDLVQWFATADSDTCPYCIGRNQWVYNRDDVTLPIHPRCRCYLAPYADTWMDDDEVEWSEKYHDKVAKFGSPNGTAKAPFESKAPIPVRKF